MSSQDLGENLSQITEALESYGYLPQFIKQERRVARAILQHEEGLSLEDVLRYACHLPARTLTSFISEKTRGFYRRMLQVLEERGFVFEENGMYKPLMRNHN